MAVPPSSDAPGLSTSRDHDRPPASSARLRRLLLAVLTAVALVAAGLTIWFVPQGRGSDDPHAADREAVMSQSRQFMLRMGTFGPEQLDDQGQLAEYRELVTEVITPKFKASFDKEASVADQMVGQVGVSREADVFSAGVSALDDDSATALVAGSFTDSFEVKGERRPQEPVPFRYELKLEKIKGSWLVDDFTPVVAEGEATDEPLPGGASPSGGATP